MKDVAPSTLICRRTPLLAPFFYVPHEYTSYCCTCRYSNTKCEFGVTHSTIINNEVSGDIHKRNIHVQKVKLSVCILWRHMGGMEIQHCAFLILALETCWIVSFTLWLLYPPSTLWTWSWVDPSTNLDTVEKINSYHAGHQTIPCLSNPQASPYINYTIPAHSCVTEYKIKHGNTCFVGEKEKEPVMCNRMISFLKFFWQK